MIWCGLIATWHSHGNRVSKTRFPCVNDVAIRCQRKQVEAPGNRVLKTRFPIGLFQILKPVSTVSLLLSLTLTPTPTPFHSQTRAPSLSDKTDPLSPCQPHPRYRRSSSHSLSPTPTPSQSHTNQSTRTVWASPTPSLVLPLSQPHRHLEVLQSAPWSPSVFENQKKKGESLV